MILQASAVFSYSSFYWLRLGKVRSTSHKQCRNLVGRGWCSQWCSHWSDTSKFRHHLNSVHGRHIMYVSLCIRDRAYDSISIDRFVWSHDWLQHVASGLPVCAWNTTNACGVFLLTHCSLQLGGVWMHNGLHFLSYMQRSLITECHFRKKL